MSDPLQKRRRSFDGTGGRDGFYRATILWVGG